MKVSELIAELEKVLKEHGDLPIYTGGQDYPTKLEKVKIALGENVYVPKGALQMRGRGY